MYITIAWYKVGIQQLVFIIFVGVIKIAHWYIFEM